MTQTHHHLKKHIKHKHEHAVSVGRGGFWAPGQNWWCSMGLCNGGTSEESASHEASETQQQESQEQGDGSAATAGGEAGEAGAVSTGSGASAGAGGM
jgi:hypothetical protein